MLRPDRIEGHGFDLMQIDKHCMARGVMRRVEVRFHVEHRSTDQLVAHQRGEAQTPYQESAPVRQAFEKLRGPLLARTSETMCAPAALGPQGVAR